MSIKKETIYPVLLLTVLTWGGLALTGWAGENRESDLTLAADYDQDGLSNDEERLYGTDPYTYDTDGDSYGDGIEVRSGYDPLVPAEEGDRILERKIVDESGQLRTNLTDKFATEVAGVAAEALSGDGEINLTQVGEDLADMTQAELDFSDLPEVDLKEIQIKKQDYEDLDEKERREKIKQDAAEYVAAVGYIVSTYSPKGDISDPANAESLAGEVMSKVEALIIDPTDVSYFKKMAERGQKALVDLEEVEVPETLLEEHLKMLQITKAAIALGVDFKADPDDPVATIAAYNQAEQLGRLAMKFSAELNDKLESLGLGGLELPF
ncbi:MAG TPA: hypothetical protein ENJ77_01325 [Candidatus Moranbacteria bacterium]|nr:hypothetical protein [Candidatus Moranbacteria bacterium]